MTHVISEVYSHVHAVKSWSLLSFEKKCVFTVGRGICDDMRFGIQSYSRFINASATRAHAEAGHRGLQCSCVSRCVHCVFVSKTWRLYTISFFCTAAPLNAVVFLLLGGTSVSSALECPPEETRSIVSLDTSQMVCKHLCLFMSQGLMCTDDKKKWKQIQCSWSVEHSLMNTTTMELKT